MADPNLVDLDFPAGVLAGKSEGEASGRFIMCDKVRFFEGRAEKVGGFTKYLEDQLNGIVRGALAWRSPANQAYVGAGTAQKAYAITDQLKDITPLDASGTLGVDPFAVVNGQTLVTVTHTAHGRVDGAIVHFSGATAGGGITINGAYSVTVVDNDHYTITHSAPATSTDSTTGGAAVAYEYELNPGYQTGVLGSGWGSGSYGTGTYGTPRTAAGIEIEMRTWFFDRYGSLVMLQPSGGTVYLWDEPGAATRAEALAGAPAEGRASFITNERMIVMLGTTTPMTMNWSDRDDPTMWVPNDDNTANERTLQVGNLLIAGTRFGPDHVIWSDEAIYAMRFLSSSDFIYETPVIGRDCGLAGPLAYAVTDRLTFWLSTRLNMHVFDGSTVSAAPNFQEVRDYFLTRVDRDRVSKTAFGTTPDKREVWIHYVSVDSVDGEPDEYLVVNYDSWAWYPGMSWAGIGRTGHVSYGVGNTSVVMFGTDSYVYRHEYGVDADGASMPWYIQADATPIYKNREVEVVGFVPDLVRQVGDITVNIKTKNWPRSQNYIDDFSFSFSPTEEFVNDFQVNGRYTSIRFSGDEVGSDFRLGICMLDTLVAGVTRSRG